MTHERRSASVTGVALSRRQIYIGGDSGYGPHFKEIGEKFSGIDLAILENGQYNADLAQIHTLPSELPQVCRDQGWYCCPPSCHGKDRAVVETVRA